MSRSRKNPRKHASAAAAPNAKSGAGGEAPEVPGLRLWLSCGFMFGTLLVWSWLAPQDATSVFRGDALPQNLFWLVLAGLSAVTGVWTGRGYRLGVAAWSVLLGCLLWMLLTAFWAGRENNPRVAWNGFWQVVSLAGGYYAARLVLLGPRSRAAALLLLLMGCIALSCHGLHQVAREFPADRARYQADPERVLQDVGLDAPAGSPDRKRFEDRLYSPEPYATYALANSLATVLSGGLILLLGMAAMWLRGRGWHDRSQLIQGVALVLAGGLVLACWFLTRSRTAYLAVFVGLGYGLLLSGGRRSLSRKSFRWGLVVASVICLVGGVWLVRNDALVLSEAPKSVAYRLEYWLATLHMLRDHGGLGVGLGNFQSYYPQYKLVTASETVADPHNWLLDVAASLSLPVGLVLVGWIVRQLRHAGQPPLGADAPESVAGWASSPPAATLSPPPQSSTNSAEELCRDLWVARAILVGGGLGGVLCAMALSLLTGMRGGVLLATWLPAAIIGWLLWPRVLTLAATPSGVMRAASLTLVVCLLASGSWQATGIAIPLCVLLILGQPLTGPRSVEPGGTGAVVAEAVAIGPGRGWWVCALPLLGLVCFIVQSWQPTTRSWALMQQAWSGTNPAVQLEMAQAAAAADPLNAEPLGWQAQLLAIKASLAPRDAFPASAAAAEVAFERWLTVDSAKFSNWQLAGKHLLELAAVARNRGLDETAWVARASSFYGEAVKRYPSSIVLRAQWAATLAVQGRWAEAHRQAAEAQRLSELSPHADKRLETQLLWLPLVPVEAEPQLGDQRPWVPAEPMLDWLRTQGLDG